MAFIGTHANYDRPGDGQYTVDSYTKILIHSNTEDNDTGNFTNSGTGPSTVSRNADVIHDNTQRITSLGATSMKFDGTDDCYLELASHSDFAPGTTPYTIDCWVRNDTSSGFSGIIDSRHRTNYDGIGQFAHTPSSYFRLHSLHNNCGGEAEEPIGSGWHHLAYVRNAGSAKIWVDGVNTDTTAIDATDSLGSDCPVRLGVTDYGLGAGPAENYSGWITEVRVSIGIARWWSSNFPVWNGTDSGQGQ